MGEKTGIQWTDHTFNPWWGCEKVSPACKHCYAETFSKRLGLPLWGGADTARRMASEKTWSEPARWNRVAEKAGERRRVFCASMADVFEDRDDLLVARARLFRLVTETPALDWMLLTKRPHLVRHMVPASWMANGFPKNVWMGTTVEDQGGAEKRVEHMFDWPCSVLFLSVEPMLSPIDLTNIEPYYVKPEHTGKPRSEFDPEIRLDALRGHMKGPDDMLDRHIDLVIVGGESGPKARPFDIDAAARIVADCRSAGVAVFTKQFGERWARDSGTHHLNAHGGDPQHWPAGDWPREFPKARKGEG
jgi:protein gp37